MRRNSTGTMFAWTTVSKPCIKGGNRMSWGVTTVECYECGKMHRLYGWLPTTLRIWNQDEGLLCCNVQTALVWFEDGVKE